MVPSYTITTPRVRLSITSVARILSHSGRDIQSDMASSSRLNGPSAKMRASMFIISSRSFIRRCRNRIRLKHNIPEVSLLCDFYYTPFYQLQKRQKTHHNLGTLAFPE